MKNETTKNEPIVEHVIEPHEWYRMIKEGQIEVNVPGLVEVIITVPSYGD